MQLELGDAQALLHDTTVRFIERELPVAATRGLHDDPLGFDRRWLGHSAELGWFAMLVPEEYGGGSVSGSGVLDAAIIAEDLGAWVQPGPFIPMNVVAHTLAAHASEVQRASLLPAIVAGDTIATWAAFDDRGQWDHGAGVRAVADGERFVLTGTRGFVQDAAAADVFLVAAACDGATVQFLVPRSAGIRVVPLECLDLSRRLGHVVLDDVAVAADARIAVDAADLDAELLTALVLVCADTVGALDRMFSMTVDYAKERVAFGRPIGSFQAIKHLLADQVLYLETCKAAAVAAAEAVQRGDDGAAETVHMAAAYVADVGNDIAQVCLQVHGGIGYTWEHDLHLYLRRVRANGALYGEPTWHRARVCALGGLRGGQ